MSDNGIRDDIGAFIAEYIDSIVQLELLLLLQRRPEEIWTPEAVARELRVDPRWTMTELSRLTARGLVSTSGAEPPEYRYAPGTPELQRSIADLIELYGKSRVSVINLIYSRPGDAIRSFADAFRLRKD